MLIVWQVRPGERLALGWEEEVTREEASGELPAGRGVTSPFLVAASGKLAPHLLF